MEWFIFCNHIKWAEHQIWVSFPPFSISQIHIFYSPQSKIFSFYWDFSFTQLKHNSPCNRAISAGHICNFQAKKPHFQRWFLSPSSAGISTNLEIIKLGSWAWNTTPAWFVIHENFHLFPLQSCILPIKPNPRSMMKPYIFMACRLCGGGVHCSIALLNYSWDFFFPPALQDTWKLHTWAVKSLLQGKVEIFWLKSRVF